MSRHSGYRTPKCKDCGKADAVARGRCFGCYNRWLRASKAAGTFKPGVPERESPQHPEFVYVGREDELIAEREAEDKANGCA